MTSLFRYGQGLAELADECGLKPLPMTEKCINDILYWVQFPRVLL